MNSQLRDHGLEVLVFPSKTFIMVIACVEFSFHAIKFITYKVGGMPNSYITSNSLVSKILIFAETSGNKTARLCMYRTKVIIVPFLLRH